MRLLPAPESAVVYSRGSGRVNRGADAGNHRGDFIRISPANFPLLNHFALPEPPRGDSSPSFHSGCGARFSENLPPAVLVPQLFSQACHPEPLIPLGVRDLLFTPCISFFPVFDFRFSIFASRLQSLAPCFQKVYGFCGFCGWRLSRGCLPQAEPRDGRFQRPTAPILGADTGLSARPSYP